MPTIPKVKEAQEKQVPNKTRLALYKKQNTTQHYPLEIQKPTMKIVEEKSQFNMVSTSCFLLELKYERRTLPHQKDAYPELEAISSFMDASRSKKTG